MINPKLEALILIYSKDKITRYNEDKFMHEKTKLISTLARVRTRICYVQKYAYAKPKRWDGGI